MGLTLEELVQSWYEGTEDAEELTRRIVLLARPIAEQAARGLNLREADVEDVAQHACDKLVARLASSGEPVTSPKALVWRIAQNKARDLHRRRKTQNEGREKLKQEPSYLSARSADPETVWLEREKQERRRALLRAALEQAPENYRRVVVLHYLEELSVEAIADRYYQEAVEAGSVPEGDPAAVTKARRRARNRVDQQLKRGRDWLKKRIALALEKEGA